MKSRALAFVALCTFAFALSFADGQTPAQNTSPSSPSTPAAGATTERPRVTSYTLPPDLYHKARNRGRINFAIAVVGLFYGLAVLWLILRSKLGAVFRDWAERGSRFRFIQAYLFIIPLVLAIAILELPLDLFREYILKVYAISVQTWSSWFADWAKVQCIAIVIGGFLAWIFFGAIRKSPVRWWFYFWLTSLPIMIFILFVSPYVIDPLFNKYEPLASKAPALVPELQRITARAGMEVPPERMFWMRASDKTVGTNASVNGFGASKRIIIWDTTLAQETTDEVLMDFGHEMGHYVLGHIWKGLVFFSALLFVLLNLGYRTIGLLLARYGEAWGICDLSDWAALTAFLLLFSLFNFFAGAVSNTYSRHLEGEADLYSMEVAHGLVSDPGQAAARSFQKYGELVLDDPTPNPIRVFLFFDHPTTADRIHFFVTYDPWSRNEPRKFIQ